MAVIAQHTDVLSSIRQPVAGHLEALDVFIRENLSSPVPLLNQVLEHIIQSGGKRMRPLLLLLTAEACGYKGEDQIAMAAVVEFIHTATLLHDDVVDNSQLRRGLETAHHVFGRQTSILVGDFLYSRAFQVIARQANHAASQYLSNVTNSMSEGEVLQLMKMNQDLNNSLNQTEASYYQVIKDKTANLFAACSYLGGLVAQQQGVTMAVDPLQLADCGSAFGMAYQIIDDVLDYSGNEQDLGKQLGDDLAEGKLTLPLIYTLSQVGKQLEKQLRQVILQRDRAQIEVVIAAMQSVGALEYCRSCAARYVEQAGHIIGGLPQSAARTALQELMQFVVLRQY